MTARVVTVLALLLAGCASAPTAVGTAGSDSTQTARIEATSTFIKLAGDSYVTVTSIDGERVDDTAFTVKAGHHVFSVHCAKRGGLGAGMAPPFALLFNLINITSDHDFSFDAEGGHVYFFKPDGDACTPYLYDHTNGHEADDEDLSVPLDSQQGPWHEITSAEYAGHYQHDFMPTSQLPLVKPEFALTPPEAYARPGWLQMFETDSWIRLTYPGNADAYFQKQVALLRNACPDAQVTVVSNTGDDVIYGAELPTNCPLFGMRSTLSRIVTGKYDMHIATLLSRTPLDDATRVAWLDVLKKTTVVGDD